MKNIFLTITRDVRVRDLLRLGTLDFLLEDPEVRVVLLTVADRDKEFLDEFSRERVEIRHLWQWDFDRKTKAIVTFRWKMKFRFLVDLFYRIERMIFPNNLYDDVFDEFPPSLVVLGDLIESAELPVALNAKRRGVPTLGMIRSWDNVLKRLAARVDTLALPNGVNRDEAINLELYRPSEVKVVGSPQFDPYFQPDVIRPRAEYLTQLGLNPRNKLIVLATAGAKLQYMQTGWLDLLLENQENNSFVKPTQIVCRNHAADVLGPFLEYEGRSGLVLDMRRRWFKSIGWTMDRADVEHVANLLYHADVVVTPASTMTLEASIFDTPVVVIAYNDYLPEITDNIMDYTFNLHFMPIVQRKLVPIARDSNQLLGLINQFLEDKSHYRMERKKIVDMYIKPSDGHSGKRIADLILEMARQ